MSRWKPRKHFSIARALKSFGGVEEAQLCAFLEELEQARLPGDLVAGWRVTRDTEGCTFEVMYFDGSEQRATASTFREAGHQLSRLMIGAAMKGAPEA